MDHLHKLYSVLKTPSIDVSDVQGTNLTQFMDISLSSAEKLNKEPDLKQQITNQLYSHLEERDTLDTIKVMFQSAEKACLIEKERELIRWLQICVSTAVEYKLTGTKPKQTSSRSVPRSPRKKKSNNDDDAYVLSSEEEEEAVVPKRTSRKKAEQQEEEEAAVPKRTSRKKADQEVEDLQVPEKKSPRKSPRKSSPKKKPIEVDSEEEDESDGSLYEHVGTSDDDFEVSDSEEDAQVPKKSPTTKKKEGSPKPVVRRKPLKEATLPVIRDGAGSKAIAKYFLDMEGGEKTALSSGYFARSFFFPSKDSFNAFISALNSATKTIDICVFAFTDDEVVATLTAAKDRGVKIKIITDNQQAAGKGADVKNLYESHGIPFRTDKTNGYMHNKFAIIDSATLINGSFNWSKGARFKNKENIIITNIPFCIQEFQTEFDSLWEEFEIKV